MNGAANRIWTCTPFGRWILGRVQVRALKSDSPLEKANSAARAAPRSTGGGTTEVVAEKLNLPGRTDHGG